MIKIFIGEWARRENVTLANLAQQIGITPSSLSQINRGAYSPKLETLEKIAQNLNIKLYMLFEHPDTYNGEAMDIKCPHCGGKIKINVEK